MHYSNSPVKGDKSKKVGGVKRHAGSAATKSSVASKGRKYPKGNNTYHNR